MTLRLITTGTEQVGPGHYQTMYRTFDCRLPSSLDLSQRTVIGFEMLNDEAVMTTINNAPVENDKEQNI